MPAVFGGEGEIGSKFLLGLLERPLKTFSIVMIDFVGDRFRDAVYQKFDIIIVTV